MVKALVLNYSDIIEPIDIKDNNYFLRVEIKFFDSISRNSGRLIVDALIDESDNQVAVENKVFDAVLDGVRAFGSNLGKGDVLMLGFKRGA